MATHPPAPVELPEFIEAYSQTAQAIVDLGLTCKDADFELATQCPGWTVKDHFSHIVGLESVLAGHPDPQVEVPDYPWIRNDFGRFMEQAVEVRRDRTGQQIVAEWRALLPERVAKFHGFLAAPYDEIDTPVGRRTAIEHLHSRLIDLWVHEQDIRAALNRPGNLDSGGAASFTQQVLDAVPVRAAKQAHLPVGTTVIIESTGPVNAREGVRIVEGEDGKPFAEALFTGEARPSEGEPGPVTTIRLSTESLTRRGAGRVPTSELRFSVEGDEQTAHQMLDALVITP